MEINEAIRKEAFRRRYSERTIETYQRCVFSFFQFCRKEPREVTKKDIREFLEQLSERTSGGTIHVYLNALKFFFEDVLRRKIKINIRYSKRPSILPRVLSKEEVRRLFEVIKNEKYRLMIKFMYSAGLRVSEVINMKVCDLDLDKNYGIVRHGKGNKDRIFIIAESLKLEIINLIEKEKLDFKDNLFLTNLRKKYSVRSLQMIIKNASKGAGLKGVHCHTLRHSFATHLIENGNSVSEVQALLGHKSPETTFIYLHLATPNMIKVKSPLDSL